MEWNINLTKQNNRVSHPIMLKFWTTQEICLQYQIKKHSLRATVCAVWNQRLSDQTILKVICLNDKSLSYLLVLSKDCTYILINSLESYCKWWYISSTMILQSFKQVYWNVHNTMKRMSARTLRWSPLRSTKPKKRCWPSLVNWRQRKWFVL